jgi:colicin import membrane protein
MRRRQISLVWCLVVIMLALTSSICVLADDEAEAGQIEEGYDEARTEGVDEEQAAALAAEEEARQLRAEEEAAAKAEAERLAAEEEERLRREEEEAAAEVARVKAEQERVAREAAAAQAEADRLAALEEERLAAEAAAQAAKKDAEGTVAAFMSKVTVVTDQLVEKSKSLVDTVRSLTLKQKKQVAAVTAAFGFTGVAFMANSGKAAASRTFVKK